MTLTRRDAISILYRLILISVSVLLLQAVAPCSAVAAGVPQYSPRIWQTDEGLPNDYVQALAQTHDGYLLVATRNGLVAFDGTHFNAFAPQVARELKNSAVTALCVDKSGVLWIGTDGGGLFHCQDGACLHYGKTNGLAGDNIRGILESRDGSVWIGTATGLSQFKDGQFTNYTRLYFTQQKSLVSSIVNSVADDQDGNLWVATSGGLNRLKGTNVDEQFTMTNGLPDNTLHSVFEDKEGRLWIGSNNGLTVYENGAFHTYTTRDGLSDNFITCIYEDRDGGIWVGSSGGLNRFVNGNFISEVNGKGESYDKVNAIFEDRDGTIWIGSKEGLVQFTPRRAVAFTKQDGLSDNNAMSVLEDRKGSLWVCTWGGGLNQIKDGKATVYGPGNGFNFPTVLSACEGRDGSLWFGSDYGGGLCRLKEGKFTYYTHKNGLIVAAIKVIHEDRSGNLWIGTSAGLSRWNGKKFKNYTSTNSELPGNMIRAICEDHAGKLWFGTDKGLSLWQNGSVTNFTTRNGLSDNVVNAVYEDMEQSLWIGTENGGLIRYRNGQFACFTTHQGLFSDRILAILEDDHGWFWLSCFKGVFRVRKSDLDHWEPGRAEIATCIGYGKADGMESAQCNGVAQPAGWKSHDGRLWFPTTKGLVSVDPNLKFDEIPPPVFVEEIIAGKKEIDLEKWGLAGAGISGEMRATLSGDPTVFTLPPGNGELEFQYGALSFSSPEKDCFKYKLEGVNSDWIDAGTRRLAHYNNIYPGRYRFLVKASNNDGVWNETGTAVSVVLLPHFWQTKWFFALVALSAAGLVGGTVRYLSWKKLRRKLAMLSMQHSLEKERARIARDIHDDLGCKLTHITMLSDEFKSEGSREIQANTDKISSIARDMARSLDEIVWAINPEHDTLEGLVNYLSRSADEFLEDTSIRLQLKAPTDVPARGVPANVRHNLFLAFREALNNSVKHSGASEMHVQFLVEPAQFEIIIVDTGIGFDTEVPQTEGNGLKNMRGRLEDLGGQFDVSSQPGRGTVIKMTVRLVQIGQY